MKRFLSLMLITTCLVAAGCAREELPTEYGLRQKLGGRESVNGTLALSEMFKRAEIRVYGWRRLSPKLEDYDVIVWFPDDYAPPDKKRRKFLEDWLEREPNRTLIYVGRDYDAAEIYWRTVLPDVPPEQSLEVARRLATITSEQAKARASRKTEIHADWFTLQAAKPRGRATNLAGPWCQGIDPQAAEIYLNTNFAIPTKDQNKTWQAGEASFVPLLTADQGNLVTRVKTTDWGSSQLLLVTNGSFLLNQPLVNRQHRALAVKLIAACGPAKKAVFLESGAGGPDILSEDPQDAYPTGLEVFTVWPLGIIVLHLTALGILICFVAFPIFGRPKEIAANTGTLGQRANTYRSGYYAGGSSAVDATSRRIEQTHFGKHIEALGELLEATQDRQYANERVKYYHEHVKRESGVSHRKKE